MCLWLDGFCNSECGCSKMAIAQKIAQPKSQENAGSPNFGLHINKKIKKITKSREFGPVT